MPPVVTVEIPHVPACSSATAAPPATIGEVEPGAIKDGDVGEEDQRVAANWLITITTQHHASLQVGPRVLAVCCPWLVALRLI